MRNKTIWGGEEQEDILKQQGGEGNEKSARRENVKKDWNIFATFLSLEVYCHCFLTSEICFTFDFAHNIKPQTGKEQK